MKIQEFISNQPMFQKLKDRYFAPMAKYEKHVPETYMKGWLKTQPSIKEVALYFIGVQGQRPASMPAILASLEKHAGLTIGENDPWFLGCYSAEAWENSREVNTLEFFDARKDFCNTGKTA